jgi:hypothetical protein
VATPAMLTFCVEGNISAGKSTFLQYITEQRAGREALATDTKVGLPGGVGGKLVHSPKGGGGGLAGTQHSTGGSCTPCAVMFETSSVPDTSGPITLPHPTQNSLLLL